MKKIFIAILTLTIILSCFGACSTPVEKLMLSNTELNMNVNDQITVSCSVLPEDATDKTVSWTSSDTNVVTVDDTGVITAVGAGVCHIVVSAQDATEIIKITVKKPVDSIVIANPTLTLNVGQFSTVSYTVLPEDATVKSVSWSSSNNSIAIVNNVGVVTAVGAGSCTITATSENITATIFVTVKVPVEQILLNKSEITIKEEEKFTPTCTVLPDNASDKNITWTSSDNSVATVSSDGTITAIKAGTCTITASADGKNATVNITVKKKGPDLKAIYNEFCQSVWADLGSDCSYLSIDTNPYNKDNGDYRYILTVSDAIEKINKKMGLPDSLYDDMIKTSWIMGRQQEIFEDVGIKVTWTYHPDQGLEVTYRLINN